LARGTLPALRRQFKRWGKPILNRRPGGQLFQPAAPQTATCASPAVWLDFDANINAIETGWSSAPHGYTDYPDGPDLLRKNMQRFFGRWKPTFRK
jgi:hypothetical protein